MVKTKKEKHKNIFWQAGIHHGGFLLLYLFTAIILNQTVIWGNDKIAKAADAVLMGRSIDFKRLFFPLAGLILLGTLAAYGKNMSSTFFNVRVQMEVRSLSGKQLLKLPYRYFDEKGTGNVMIKLISDVAEAGKFFSEILPQLLMDIITVVMVSVYLFEMDTFLMIIVLASCPITLLISGWLSKRLSKIAKKWRVNLDERTQVAYDAVQGIVVGRSYGLYQVMKKRIDGTIDNIADLLCKSTYISSAGWVITNIITTIPIILCYLIAFRELMQGKITTGELLAFVVLLGRIIYPLENIMFCVNDIRQVGVSMQRIESIFSQETERDGEGDFRGKAEALQEGDVVIDFDKVFFSYEEGKPVLSELSFQIKKMENVAFVGGSGEGKSTIFKLLCKFYEKQSGSYQLFGQPIEEWRIGALRSCFSVVSQNVFLFPESIRQNIVFGRSGATMEEIIIACKNANIHEFIMSLPNGYDTLVGERGVRLSGGERQRISIARAFLKNAPILLLDEPTASVDEETEAEIKEAIKRISRGRTVITIAHRLSTIQNADRILVIQNGKVAEEGCHRQLLAKEGIYGGLYGKETK